MAPFRSLVNALRRPNLFENVEESFWRDPYISEQILEAHLDPAVDDASRRAAVIARSTAWIARLVEPRSRLLDLGCGPGLYCEGFHRYGLKVTGIDYSTTAVEYARREAARRGHSIDYGVADYRSDELPSPFEIVTLIYGGICCITNEERDDLLARIHRTLVPGGFFVFDVFTADYIDHSAGDWYVKLTGGFWRSGAHLVIEKKHEYPEADAHLDRYIVVDPRRGLTAYNMWKHYYTKETIASVLSRAGFEPVGWYGDLSGAPFHPRGPWIGIVARA